VTAGTHLGPTVDGLVTLRGPVASTKEKASVAAKAEKVAGATTATATGTPAKGTATAGATAAAAKATPVTAAAATAY
jgi:hypothetical protein